MNAVFRSLLSPRVVASPRPASRRGACAERSRRASVGVAIVCGAGFVLALTPSSVAVARGTATPSPPGETATPPAPPDLAVRAAVRSAQAVLSALAATQRTAIGDAVRSIPPVVPLSVRAAPLDILPTANRDLGLETGSSALTNSPSVVHPGTTAASLAAALAAGGDTIGDYAYRTIYTPTSGTPLARYTEAVLGEPTPLNVTAGGGTQFTATISPSSATSPVGVTLTIARAASMPAGDRVSIEAVLIDPASPDTYIGFGEDGSTAGTAQSWSANVINVSYASSSAEIELGPVSAATPPSSLAVLGELFSGSDPDSPKRSWRGDISFDPMPAAPATVAIDIRLSAGELEAGIVSGAPTPTLVYADLTAFRPGESQDIEATLDDLSKLADFIYKTTGGEQSLSYAASSVASALDVEYSQYRSGALAEGSEVDATGVPTEVTVAQLGPVLSVTTPSGGSISSIDAGYSDGTGVPASPAGTGAYLSYDQTATTATTGVRLYNLEDLAVVAAEPYAMNLEMTASLPSVALSSSDATDGVQLTGDITALPAHTTVSVDLTSLPKECMLKFDGYGDALGQFHVEAIKTTPFFGRVTTVDVTATAIPPSETLGFAKSGAYLSAMASVPLGALSLLLSDGSAAPAVSGPYLDYVDTPTQFLSFATLEAFSSILIGGSSGAPLAGFVGTATSQVVAFRADTSAGVFNGSVNLLPHNAGFVLVVDSAGDQVLIVTSSSPIPSISITGSDVPLPVPATNVAITLTDVPTKLTLALPGPNQALSFAASSLSARSKPRLGRAACS